MPTIEEISQSEEIQKMMKDAANKAVAEEIEKIKSEIEIGRTKYDPRRLKKRLEDVSNRAVELVIDQAFASASGSLGMIKSGPYFYPIVPQPSLVIWIPAAVELAKLAAVGIAALAAGEGIKELDEWYNKHADASKESIVRQNASDIISAARRHDIDITDNEANTLAKMGLTGEFVDNALTDTEQQAVDAGQKAGELERDSLLASMRVGSSYTEDELERKLRDAIERATREALRKKGLKYPALAEIIKKNWKEFLSVVFSGISVAGIISLIWFTIKSEVPQLFSFRGMRFDDALTSFQFRAKDAYKANDYALLKSILDDWDEMNDEYSKWIDKNKKVIDVPSHKASLNSSVSAYKEYADKMSGGKSKGVGSSSSNTISGRIVKVTDGDTLVMSTDDGRRVTIRVLGLECPERGQESYKYCNEIARSLIEGEYATATI